MLGSHGPVYYRRYPTDMALFSPDCNTSNFAECSLEQIVNAYDNTIVYTDKILAELIDVLISKQNQFASTMIYMSDHDESLGEKGLYLHGMPYFIAPREQTHIPFISWFSPEFLKQNNLSKVCLKNITTTAASHDNLFHLILGVMDIKTKVYDKSLDLFSACRSNASESKPH